MGMGGRRPGSGRKRRVELTPETISCRQCGSTKPAAEFHQDRSHATGKARICRSCHAENLRIRRAAKGLKLDHCEACGATEQLVVDHDHRTQRYRGTLCRTCNLIVGHLENQPDYPQRIRALQRYLRRRP